MTQRIGFCCKWLDTPDQINGLKPKDPAKLLNTGVTTVTFVKSDGSLREMQATLDPVHVPESAYKVMSPGTLTENNKKPREENNDVCKVWDTEAAAWRSFRYDRIKTISISLG